MGRIRYGKVEVSDDAFKPANVRRRISIMIPEDVLTKLRKRAAQEGVPYQTFINMLLHKATR